MNVECRICPYRETCQKKATVRKVFGVLDCTQWLACLSVTEKPRKVPRLDERAITFFR